MNEKNKRRKDNIKERNNKNKIKLKFMQGSFNEKDFISPTYINNNNPKYFEVDNMFYSGLLVVNYNREYEDLILKNIIEKNNDMNISIFYEKQNQYKTIKDLTYYIGNTGADLHMSNQNRNDIDIAAFTYNDAKYIRKEMQVKNEDLYFLYIYLILYSENKKELDYQLNNIEGILQSKGMQTRRAYFREEEIFLSSIPILKNHDILKQSAKRNVLTSSLISTYPFISSTIFDQNGIFIRN